MPRFEFNDLTILLAQIAVIVFVSRSLGLVTRWLGQPLVIAEVLAGIVLGPSVLGWLWPPAMTALFPANSLSSLQLLSQVGLVLFMFLIGLELDPRLLKGRARSSIIISHSSIIAPFGLGTLVAGWLYASYSSTEVPLSSFLLFLGASMSVTAFPVLARILSERHLLTSRVGVIAVACAAVDDVTAWCLLAFVVAVARSGGIAAAAWTTALAGTFLAAMLLVVRPFLQRLSARVASPEGLTPTVIAFVLLLLCCSSLATELIGIHALFGAFLFGAILPKEGKLAETLIEKLETTAVVLLLPLFFAYSGLRTQIGLVSDARDWLVTGLLILVATLGKFGGSALAARVTGLGWREASAIGILMNTRGLMELIVLNIGLDIGVLSPTVFTMLVLMALVTTFVTTPALQWVYPDRELRDSLMKPAADAPGEPASFTVMMCVSDPTLGPGLATVAAALAGRGEERARLVALHLWRPSDHPAIEWRHAGLVVEESSPLQPLLRRARELELEVQPLEFVSAEPAADICRTARATDASLVLLGAHKPLLLGGHLSGTVSEVVRRTKGPVAVFMDRGLRQVSRVLVAFGSSPEDLAALRLAQRMTATPATSLTLLHVVSPGETAQEAARRAQIEEMFAGPIAEGSKVSVLVTVHASPTAALIEEAARGYDLVVLGMRSRWDLDTSVLARKRRSVLTETSVSVLAVHAPASASLEVAPAPSPRPGWARASSA